MSASWEISREEIAERLAVTKDKVNRMVRAGVIPSTPHADGLAPMVLRAEFERWLAEGRPTRETQTADLARAVADAIRQVLGELRPSIGLDLAKPTERPYPISARARR